MNRTGRTSIQVSAGELASLGLTAEEFARLRKDQQKRLLSVCRGHGFKVVVDSERDGGRSVFADCARCGRTYIVRPIKEHLQPGDGETFYPEQYIFTKPFNAGTRRFPTALAFNCIKCNVYLVVDDAVKEDMKHAARAHSTRADETNG